MRSGCLFSSGKTFSSGTPCTVMGSDDIARQAFAREPTSPQLGVGQSAKLLVRRRSSVVISQRIDVVADPSAERRDASGKRRSATTGRRCPNGRKTLKIGHGFFIE
jgi:hypothetical protein